MYRVRKQTGGCLGMECECWKGHKERVTKDPKETFECDRYIHHPDCGEVL